MVLLFVSHNYISRKDETTMKKENEVKEVKGLKKFYQDHKTACLFVGGALVGAGLAAGGYYIYTNYFKQDTGTDMNVITVTDDDVEALKGATSLAEAINKAFMDGKQEGAVIALHAVGAGFPEMVKNLGEEACCAFDDELQRLPNFDQIDKLINQGLLEAGRDCLDPMAGFMERNAVKDVLQFGKDLVAVTHIDDNGWAIAPDDTQ